MHEALSLPVTQPLGYLVAGVAVLTVTLLILRVGRSALKTRLKRAVRTSIRRFRVRLERYKFVSRGVIRRELMADPVVNEAIRDHAAENGLTEMETRVRVEAYITEIIPFFNVLSYYKFGYNVARLFVNLLYKPSFKYLDPGALDAVPQNDVVVYVMNHRSNADYLVVAYLLAHDVSISYAVGEWARVWPLEYVFKSFGSYFIRRRYREQLYHTVLERYINQITRNGITQGIFLEGGLTRNGAFRTAKIGLLDYIARTMADPGFRHNVWLVPTAINYDRVLEDRTLIRELVQDEFKRSPLDRGWRVATFLAANLVRAATLRVKRYGRVAVHFGTPISLAEWRDANPGVLGRSREERLPVIQQLADGALNQIASLMPVTPIPLVAASILSLGETLIRENDLIERVSLFTDHLQEHHPGLLPEGQTPRFSIDRAWRTFQMRRWVVREGGDYLVLPGQRALLEYYANSIIHLLPPIERTIEMHPARDRDDSLTGLTPG